MFGRKVRCNEVAVGPRTKAIRLRLACPRRNEWVRGADHRFSIDLRDESVVMLLAKPGPGRPSGERPHDIVIPIHFVGEGRTAMAMNPVLFLAPVGGGPQKVCAAVIELPILGGQTGPEEALVEIELAPLE